MHSYSSMLGAFYDLRQPKRTSATPPSPPQLPRALFIRVLEHVDSCPALTVVRHTFQDEAERSLYRETRTRPPGLGRYLRSANPSTACSIASWGAYTRCGM